MHNQTIVRKAATLCITLMALTSSELFGSDSYNQIGAMLTRDSSIVYAVVVDGEALKCIDSSNGMTVGSISNIGRVIQGPNVNGSRCTVVTESHTGRKGTVYELPSFTVVTTFDADP